MSYVGGKARHTEFILDVLNDPQFDGLDYVEPFCGMCHVLWRVQRKRSYAASDAHPLLRPQQHEEERVRRCPRTSRGRGTRR